MSQPSPAISRRRVLTGAAGLAAASVVASAPASAQGSDYDGWFDNTSNYDGTVDKRGEESVTITVGAAGNGGDFAYAPAAVQVDPGTTLVWEWTGKGGSHDVAAEDGSFQSDMTDEAGFTFEHTVEGEGVSEYACTPHATMGMKGVVVAGDLPESASESSADADEGTTDGPEYGDWFDGVSNYEETADRTGEDEVTVAVGAPGNGGALAFDPPAMRVDPGTTLVWEWTGDGSHHNVVADDGGFESDLTDEAGFTFERSMTEAGVHKYVCAPHEQMGMRGAVFVGDGDGASSESDTSEMFVIGGGIGMIGALFAIFLAGLKGGTPDNPPKPRRT